MDIGEIVSDSVMYPSSDWIKVLLLGFLTLLGAIIAVGSGFLVIFLGPLALIFILLALVPIIMGTGFGFRALKASMAGSEELPDFDEWGEMFIDGLKVFVVEFIYALPALIILLIGLGSTFAGAYFGNGSFDPMALFGVGMIAILVAAIVGLILQLFSTIAVANMGYNDSEFGAAFRFSDILEIISQIGWVDYIIWFVVIVIIGGAIMGVIINILNIIPLIGGLVGVLLISPYYQLFFYRALALLYAYE